VNYRAELSIAAETSSYLGKVVANLGGALRPRIMKGLELFSCLRCPVEI